LYSLLLKECTIESEGMKLRNDIKYKLKKIQLDRSGHPNYSNWLEKPEKFQAILKAIVESSLVNELEVIDVEF